MLKRSGALCLIFTALALGLAAAAAARAQEAGAVKVNPKDGAVMVYVPAGAFTMGTDLSDIPEALQGGFKNAPKHMVTLSGYWIYKNDVTVAEYKAFCQATSRAMPPAPSWGWKDDHPVVNVSWDDATAYAAWAHVALPTEAQWEKAARGTAGRAYPWGNEWAPSRCAHSNSRLGDLGSTQPAGSYPQGASSYGCLDMAGNVWQWCADWYDRNHYNSAPSTNPTGPASGADRVLRGGSWGGDFPGIFRAADRSWSYPTGWLDFGGFRCSSRLD
jgi:formylglycine-generating enzyme required for sulfatase activity